MWITRRKDVTIQQRRGKTYVNDRLFDNLPEVYQRMLPKLVAHFEKTQIDDKRGFDSWVMKLRGEPRTFTCEGVMLELENGDEYGVPFFFFSEDDLKILQPGWQRWLAAEKDRAKQEQESFLLQTQAQAYQQDRMANQQIADDATSDAGIPGGPVRPLGGPSVPGARRGEPSAVGRGARPRQPKCRRRGGPPQSGLLGRAGQQGKQKILALWEDVTDAEGGRRRLQHRVTVLIFQPLPPRSRRPHLYGSRARMAVTGCRVTFEPNRKYRWCLRLATPGEGPFRSIRQANTLMCARMCHQLKPFPVLLKIHPFFGMASAVPSKGAGEELGTMRPHLGEINRQEAHQSNVFRDCRVTPGFRAGASPRAVRPLHRRPSGLHPYVVAPTAPVSAAASPWSD